MRTFGIYRIYDAETNHSFINWSNNLWGMLDEIESKRHPAYEEIPEEQIRIETLRQITVSDILFSEFDIAKVNTYLICQATAFIEEYRNEHEDVLKKA